MAQIMEISRVALHDQVMARLRAMLAARRIGDAQLASIGPEAAWVLISS
jgi:hypothetical protein